MRQCLPLLACSCMKMKSCGQAQAFLTDLNIFLDIICHFPCVLGCIVFEEIHNNFHKIIHKST